MSNRYKRIHTPAPKYQKWIAGVTEYIHTKDLLAGYLVRMETPYHFLLYNLKQIKELKSQLQNSQNRTRCSYYFGGTFVCVCKYKIKKNSVRKDVYVSTSVHLLFINVGIPPQTVSATLYLKPEL